MVVLTACTQPETQDSSSEMIPSQSESIYNEIESTQEKQPEPQQMIVEISTAEQLFSLSLDYGMGTDDYENIKYILTNDIDMSGIVGFNPIGLDRHYNEFNGMDKRGFKSHFDGQGYTIRNLTIDYNGDAEGRNGNVFAGLFGVVAKTAVIENLNIENIKIDGIGRNAFHYSNSGALAGCFSGKAINVHASGEISSILCSGGLIGKISGETYIENCTADVDVSGCWYTGGFLGYSDGTAKNVTIKNCASFGSVTAFIPSVNLDEIRDIGGFAGLFADGTLENCHSRARLIIKNTAVSVGAFLAHTHKADIINCTYDTDYTGSWQPLFHINFVRCNGDYTPYSFTTAKKQPSDYRTNMYGVDTSSIMATSKDGNYVIYESDSTVAGDGGLVQCSLKEITTGNLKSLGSMMFTRGFDTGFFSNGDAYMMNEYEGIRIYNTDMSDTSEIFNSGKYLPCGENIDGNGTERYLFAIRRDPQAMDYIVLYTEFVRGDKLPSDFNYIIGKLDAEGRLVYTQQLPAKIQWQDQLGFLTVNMYKSAENEIEFYTSYKDRQITKGRFNFATQQYTGL